MMRDQRMGTSFLNKWLIPLLCKAAGLVDEHGIPLRDTVGKITSHRARSTLALFNRRQNATERGHSGHDPVISEKEVRTFGLACEVTIKIKAHLRQYILLCDLKGQG
jgi:hypothetical protein